MLINTDSYHIIQNIKLVKFSITNIPIKAKLSERERRKAMGLPSVKTDHDCQATGDYFFFNPVFVFG